MELKKFRIVFTLLLSILLTVSCSNGNTSKSKELSGKAKQLVGIWLDSPMIADGYGERYRFYPNGVFQMHSPDDCLERLKGFKGTWELKGDTLNIELTEKQEITGGKIIETGGGCDKELVEGKLETFKITAEKKNFTVSDIKKDQQFEMPEDMKKFIIKFGGKSFWKYSDDPNEYK